MPTAATPTVLVGGTGMVRLPAKNGGGIESYVHDILQMFDEPAQGPEIWNVRAVSDWAPEYEFASRCVPVRSPIDRYPIPPLLSAFAHGVGGLLTARAILKEARRAPPDVLHLNEEISIRWCRKIAARKILTLHSPAEFLVHLALSQGRSDRDALADGRLDKIMRRIDWAIVHEALSSYDGVIVLTSLAKEMLAQVGVSSTLIPPSVSTERFFPPVDADRRAPRSILFVGRLEKRKDPRLLVRALARLPRDVTLTLVGRGPEERPIRALVARLGLTSRVTILPACSPPALADLYRNAGLFVLPSHIEAYGKVLNEALASGLPALVPQSSVYTDLIREHVVSTYSSLDECVDTIGRLLDQTAVWRSLSNNARHFAQTNLSYPSIRKSLAKVYGISLSDDGFGVGDLGVSVPADLGSHSGTDHPALARALPES